MSASPWLAITVLGLTDDHDVKIVLGSLFDLQTMLALSEVISSALDSK